MADFPSFSISRNTSALFASYVMMGASKVHGRMAWNRTNLQAIAILPSISN
ncbi:hypothetical protein PALA111701_16900 [Paenibacillus lactis]